MGYEQHFTLPFRSTDMAGQMYFGAAFDLAHDAAEGFVVSLGFDWGDWFASPTLGIPIRHAEADFHRPLKGGAPYRVCVWVARLGRTSVQLAYDIMDGETLYARVRLVHAFLDKSTGRPTEIPAAFRSALAAYEAGQDAPEGLA